MARKDEIILQIKTKRLSKGVHRVAFAGILFALAYVAVQVLRVFGVFWYAEFAGMGIELLSWGIMYTGLCEFTEYNPPVKRARAVSVVMVIASAFQILFALFAVRKSGLNTTEAFVDGKVMLMQYLMILGLFYVAYQCLRTLRRRLEVASTSEKIPSTLHKGWPCYILMLLSILCIPASALFYDDTIRMAGVVIFGALFLICEAVLSLRIAALGKQMVKYRVVPAPKNRN